MIKVLIFDLLLGCLEENLCLVIAGDFSS